MVGDDWWFLGDGQAINELLNSVTRVWDAVNAYIIWLCFNK